MTDGGPSRSEQTRSSWRPWAVVSGAVGGAPADVVAAAKATFTWRTIDAELAELTFDSVADTDALAGVRGGGGPRALTFEHDDVVVEVEVSEHAAGRTLVGQVAAAALGVDRGSQASGAATRPPREPTTWAASGSPGWHGPVPPAVPVPLPGPGPGAAHRRG